MFSKNVKFSNFGAFLRRFVGLIVLLSLSGNHLALAVPPSSAPLEILPALEELESFPSIPSAPPSENARALPSDVAELPELVARRTSDSATFQVAEDRYVSVLGVEDMHYQDSQGAWQVIDPAFRPVENSFIVEHNAIRSRVGFSETRLSAAVGNTGIIWQATALGTSTADRFTPLAEILDEPPNFARKYDEDRLLRYEGNWSDPSLSEEIVSKPGNLEHLLILSQAPQATGEPEYLEMQATLKLLPGSELWANGEVQTETFRTTGSLEIHGVKETEVMVLDPILAYERERPAMAVGGTYVAQPGDEPNTWIIGVRTPWPWWVDPQRRYPVAIDPTMHVLRSAGYGSGMAWMAHISPGKSNPDTPDESLHFNEMVLGSWNGDGRYKNYVQFNRIPYMLTNAPVSITAAYLDIEPAYARMPDYNGGHIDWEMISIQSDATLYDLGQCPGDCNGFSLISEPTGFTWDDLPAAGTPVDTGVAHTLVVPPVKGGGQTYTTTWDVTDIVRAWNQQSPRLADGPAFRIELVGSCPVGTFQGDQAAHIPACTRMVVPAGGARLRIEYAELPLAIGDSLVNAPGVPSFSEGVFADVNHQYDLSTYTGDSHWRAVAVRGNHAIDPASPTWAGLKIFDYSGGGSDPVALGNATVQAADTTAIALLDDHNLDNSLRSADLKAEVTASNQNNFPSDGSRNYRVEYKQADDWDVQYSTWTTETFIFRTDRLISMGEFELEYGDSVLVRVTAPVTFPLELGLAAPTDSDDTSTSVLGNVNLDKSFESPGLRMRTKEMTFVQTEGTWALAMFNTGRPDTYGARKTPRAHEVTVEILRCRIGSVATAKWDCQPVTLPHSGTESATGLGLTVYSEGGFTGDPAGDTWCTINEGSGTPFIGPSVDGRWIVVGQGSVCRNGDIISTTAESGIGLAITNSISPTFGKITPAFFYGSVGTYPVPDGDPTGVVIHSGDSGLLVPAKNVRRNIKPFEEYWDSVFAPTLALDYISTTDMMVIGSGTISVPVMVDSTVAPENLSWDVPWVLYPEETELYDYVFEVTPDQSPALSQPALLASLEVRVLDEDNIDTGLVEALDVYKFESNVDAGQFRADRAKVTQDVKLGGATKNIQVVIQPPGAPRLPAALKSCSYENTLISCLDLRRDDYQWNNSNGDKNIQEWELPDVHVEDSANLVMFNRPGNLQIFSADHPLARTSVDQSFSFDTFGASVSVSEEPCSEGGPVVTVVKGSASIGLPSVGDDGSSGAPSIKTNFKLCSAELRQAELILTLPTPGIPVGSTGMGVYMIGGKVTIDPDYTQIEFQLGFQTLDGTTLTNGVGAITIDTRGLFKLQVTATIVTKLDAELTLQVAWNPLDILLEAQVKCFGGLISGGLRMHAWIGQGWQNAYSWLPDNDDFHFTGSIEATLRIPEGYIADLGIFELPPFDFSIGIRIAFGEFCTNDDCTDYDWGMSGVLTVCGFDVGMYVDSSGPELILGTDDHVLIDQFAGTSRQKAAIEPQATTGLDLVETPGALQPSMMLAPDTPVDDWDVELPSSHGCTGGGTSVHTCPFTVTQSAGRAMFSVSWENGDLDVALITPGNETILPSNAITYGVTVSETSTSLMHQIIFGVPQEAIVSGTWQLRLNNVISDSLAPYQTNYQLLFVTEPPPPTLEWLTPVISGTTPGAGDIVNLEWTALRGGQPLSDSTQIELVYIPVADKPVTPTQISGTLIVNQITATLGSYEWNTQGLASGEYAVGARIDDHLYANGHIFAWAPGTVVINDTTPPPVPVIHSQIDRKDALIVVWLRDSVTRDLAGYLVEYTIPAWNEADQLTKVRRVLPHPYDKWPRYEYVRLGGLLSGLPTTVCVRAYDASGNVSGCQQFTHVVSFDQLPTVGPPIDMGGGTTNMGGKTSMHVVWSPPAIGTAAGYYLSYQIAGCVLPDADSLADQGSSPIDVGDATSVTLTGLTVGQTYRIAVNAYMANGFVGPSLEGYEMFVDPANSDNDGLSDQWAELYGITDGAGGDRDQDGLNNFMEYQLKSNPNRADSDGDGYYDNEEVYWGTAVCGPQHPPYHTEPKLTLAGKANIKYLAAENQTLVPAQVIRIFNLGGDTLEWQAITSDPWISVSQSSGTGMAAVYVTIDPIDLDAGSYAGAVLFRGFTRVTKTMQSQLAAPLVETATVQVELQVLPPKDFAAEIYPVYLPLVLR